MDIKKHDHEASMAKAELLQIANNAVAVFKMINEGDNLDGWVSSHISVANEQLNSVHEKMQYEQLKAASINRGPREYEESVQEQIKHKLAEQWLQKKHQGK